MVSEKGIAKSRDDSRGLRRHTFKGEPKLKSNNHKVIMVGKLPYQNAQSD